MDILGELNERQKEAVQTPAGPLLILAGPGSGKTRVIAHRIAWLLSQGTAASRILAVTFTNKAAEEMRGRVHRLIENWKLSRVAGFREAEKIENCFIGTFHAFGAEILRRDGFKIGLPRRFLIYDEDDRSSLVKELCRAENIPAEFSPAAFLAAISRLKNEMQSPASARRREAAGESLSGFFGELVSRLLPRYEAMLLERGAVDFDDLLTKPLLLFTQHPETLEAWSERFDHILVDEYQDTNPSQYALIKLLTKENKNLTVVGDDWQAIYAWRQADFRNMLKFEHDFPEAKIVFLEENYRSTRTILAAAQAVIKENRFRTEKTLFTRNGAGEPLEVFLLEDEREEAAAVAEVTRRFLQDGWRRGDMAVLFRTNAQSRALEEAMLTSNIPYRMVGGLKFYQRKEIKDLLAYLRLALNPKDAASFLRVVNVPPRGIGKAALAKNGPALEKFQNLLEEFRTRAENLPLAKLLQTIILKTRYEAYLRDKTERGEERWENVQELLGVVEKFDELPAPEGSERFLQEVALLAEADEVETEKDVVNLMTLHASKGLEFPIVFITGAEEGLLPHARSLARDRELEEERRLCYVGMTRAKERLVFFLARRRSLFGETKRNPVSRFLQAIPQEYIRVGNRAALPEIQLL
ncbi:UvrD-helicase domain-containing protein [Candidatus Azambacteria bacterium]|nr:UvrD-helicase domain-containing protein [Candidatus Azambacteria bacterium]